ncbi:MAG: glycerophosphodiester phosphodiesterase [Actinomycetota bacterium]|nr:glycerophosphodiester phosphodiesterase [Actinomycetota bacterium]MDQ3528586.1 glycerophosphodiester phosphodiesterase [Actinomycetota bacterium]
MHPRTLKMLVTTLVATLLLSTAAAAQPVPRAGHPPRPKDASVLVIGHRGASGYRPEHTMAAYKLAIRLGADYIEPDLVSTKNGILVARHENEISQTTDVDSHPEFADRRTTKIIDGRPLTGWFTEDFTLRELRTLRAKERIPETRQRNTLYDGRELIPTFQQVINLAKRASRSRGRPIGIYPETKHPTYFDSIGLSLEEPLVRALRRNGLDRRKAPVFVQSFETANLRQLDKIIRVPLVQLIAGSGAPYDRVAAGSDETYDDLVTPAGLRRVARYADGIGPDKNRIIPRDAGGFLQEPTSLVDDAHAENLLVHPYTFRNENVFLPADYRSAGAPDDYGNAFAEYERFFELGVDGIFSDNPDTAVEARRDFAAAAAAARD